MKLESFLRSGLHSAPETRGSHGVRKGIERRGAPTVVDSGFANNSRVVREQKAHRSIPRRLKTDEVKLT